MKTFVKKILVVVLSLVVLSLCVVGCAAKEVTTKVYVAKVNPTTVSTDFGEVVTALNYTLVVGDDNKYELTQTTNIIMGTAVIGSNTDTFFGEYTVESDGYTATYKLGKSTRVVNVNCIPTTENFTDTTNDSTLGDYTLDEYMAEHAHSFTVICDEEMHTISNVTAE